MRDDARARAAITRCVEEHLTADDACCRELYRSGAGGGGRQGLSTRAGAVPLVQDPSRDRSAASAAVAPVHRVGSGTGTKRGEWFTGIVPASTSACEKPP